MSRKIVVALMSREQEFQAYQAADAEATARREGLEIELLFAQDNAIQQIQQLLPVVQAPGPQRPAAIVVEPIAGDGLERLARESAQAGIAWILLNRRVPYAGALRAENPQVPVLSVSTDQVQVGRIQGHQLAALLPKGGTVLYLEGKADSSPARERLAGAREVLEETGGFSLRVYAGDWSEASGYRAASGWLRPRLSSSERPQAVASQNDSMAMGARRAFQELRPEWAGIPFLGVDCIPDGGQQLVRKGELAASVATLSSAGPAIELVSQWLETRILPPSELILPPRSFPALEDLARPPRR